MTTQLVKQAVELFIETIPMESMDANHPQFHHLYSQECKLFDCLRRMSEGEKSEYKAQIADIDPEVGSILTDLNNMINQ